MRNDITSNRVWDTKVFFSSLIYVYINIVDGVGIIIVVNTYLPILHYVIYYVRNLIFLFLYTHDRL